MSLGLTPPKTTTSSPGRVSLTKSAPSNNSPETQPPEPLLDQDRPAASTRSAAPVSPLPAGPLPLHLRLRPQTLQDVLGQEATTVALARLLSRPDRPHLYFLSGPSGTGKTTLARIIASMLNAAVTEIDAATNSGVDDARSLTDFVSYRTLDGKPKVLILDEVHALSKAAWQALLKTLEEPPPNTYFMLCTTDPDKVPATIKTRACAFTLKPVPSSLLEPYAVKINEQEKLNLPDVGIKYIVANANGSPRQLLVDMAKCAGAESVAEIQQLLEDSSADDNVLALCRMLASDRRSFDRAVTYIKKIKGEQEPEGVRISMVEYLSAVFVNSDKPPISLIPFLDLLSQPLPARGGWAKLIANLYLAFNAV